MPNESFTYLELNDVGEATDLLADAGVLQRGETIESLDVAGPGNMNVVLRVTTNQRAFIAKQSRPWVQKFPSIPAPEDRLLAEIDFYRFVESMPEVIRAMPGIVGFSRSLHLLILEDLGASADYGHVYASQSFEDLPLADAAGWLAELHRESAKRIAEMPSSFSLGSNQLRGLNHQHMFRIPFLPEPAADLDAITPGLADLGNRVAKDSDLLRKIEAVGEVYLHPRKNVWGSPVLLHGDFYPGSLLHTCDGLRVIDAEFCFIGPAEFDLGILSAHLRLAGGDDGQIRKLLDHYRSSHDSGAIDRAELDNEFLKRVSGVEILRRVLGVAQLPLPSDLALKRRLIADAIDLLG